MENSVPVHIVDEQLAQHPLLREYCNKYLPRRIRMQLLEMAARLATMYPMFTSVDFYEQRLQCAVKFVIDRIDEFRHIKTDIGGNDGGNVIGAVAKGFAYKLTMTIFDEAFTQLRTLHREVLRYRYYHVFNAGELDHLLAQINGMEMLPKMHWESLQGDYECGNWFVHARRRTKTAAEQ